MTNKAQQKLIEKISTNIMKLNDLMKQKPKRGGRRKATNTNKESNA